MDDIQLQIAIGNAFNPNNNPDGQQNTPTNTPPAQMQSGNPYNTSSNNLQNNPYNSPQATQPSASGVHSNPNNPHSNPYIEPQSYAKSYNLLNNPLVGSQLQTVNAANNNNFNYLQNNPLNGPQQPFPQQSYQPQPMCIPPPPAKSNPTIQVYQINSSPNFPPCPYCRNMAPTITQRTTSQAQLFWCFILFLFAPFICYIPFCMSSCDDINCVCSSCGRVIKTIRRPIC
jgi:hypothetical protein